MLSFFTDEDIYTALMEYKKENANEEFESVFIDENGEIL